MKRTLVTLASVVAAMAMTTFTSCNKEEQATEFTATMEACTDIQGKTVLSGTDLNWVAGDQIAIYGTGGNGVYSATPQTPATTAAFARVSGSSVSAPCRAYYPATLTTDGVNITLPAAQTYVAGSMQEFPMYAESGTSTLAFRNLCGALKLHLTKANTNISTIAVTAATPINGLFTVDYNSGNPVLTPVTGSATGTTTMLSCATAQAIDNGADFFIYLPAGNYTGLEIELNTDDGRHCILTANTTIPVTRSQYTTINLGENDLNFTTPLPQGALPGLFTINDDGDQVRFSQGNLQYQASTDTWRFAEHQYDYVGTQTADIGGYYGGNVSGSDNCNIGATYVGWIDLFGWGTGSNPTLVSTDPADYSTFVDWGSNAISNGGNAANSGWRTLTSAEWAYLFNTRDNTTNLGTANARYAKGNVNGLHGMIIFPDGYAHPSGVAAPRNINNEYVSGWYNNNYTLTDWEAMETAGAVFFPAAGIRLLGTSVYEAGHSGHYWSSTPSDFGANSLYGFFDPYGVSSGSLAGCIYGLSVRLVRDNN